MRARARDQKGQGTAAATITSTMEEVAGGTRVRVETEMQVSGPAAQFGRGVMQEISAKLMSRFADCLADEIGQASAAAPARPAVSGAPEAVAAGTAGIRLPRGPAAAAAEAAARGPTEAAARGPAAAESAARGRATPAGAPSRSPASPPAADDVAGPRSRPTDDVLDLGAIGRAAVLKRALPIVALVAALAALIAVLGRRRR
jgi:hypothetical protein